MAYPMGERIEWSGAEGCAIGMVMAKEVWVQLKPWEKGWLQGYRFGTTKKGTFAVEGYLRNRVRKLMEGK